MRPQHMDVIERRALGPLALKGQKKRGPEGTFSAILEMGLFREDYSLHSY